MNLHREYIQLVEELCSAPTLQEAQKKIVQLVIHDLEKEVFAIDLSRVHNPGVQEDKRVALVATLERFKQIQGEISEREQS